MIQVLTEVFDAGSSILEELNEETGRKEKKYFLEGICIQANVKNRNGRVYPKPLVDREVNRYIKEYVNNNRALGELNHPDDSPSVNYERVSHKYISLTESGDNWIGRAQVTNKTPCGAIVAGLMECGVTLGTSSRARGSVKLQEGVKVVQTFALVTPGDIVSDPSAPDAFLTGLMEGKEWAWANGVLVEKEAEILDTVNTVARTRGLGKAEMQTLFAHIMSKI